MGNKIHKTMGAFLNLLTLAWRSGLERSPRKREDGFSNPSCDRSKS